MTHDIVSLPDRQLFAHVGARLTELRSQAGFSMIQVAEKTGIKTDMIERYEAGLGEIHAAHVYRLASCYHVSPADVFAGLPSAHGKSISNDDVAHLVSKFLTIDAPDRGERFGQFVQAIRQQQGDDR